MIKSALAVVGSVVIFLSIMGSIGVGHFRFYYGPDVQGCAKMESAHAQPSQHNESE